MDLQIQCDPNQNFMRLLVEINKMIANVYEHAKEEEQEKEPTWKNTLRRLAPRAFQVYFKTTIIKTLCCLHQATETSQ